MILLHVSLKCRQKNSKDFDLNDTIQLWFVMFTYIKFSKRLSFEYNWNSCIDEMSIAFKWGNLISFVGSVEREDR